MTRLSLSLTVLLLVLLARPCRALDYADLSEEARQIVPETRMMEVVDGNGVAYEGVLVSHDAEKVVIKVRKSEALSMSKQFKKSEIRSVRALPVDDVFFAKLLEQDIEDEELESGDYRRLAALHAEFASKCGSHGKVGLVKERLAVLKEAVTFSERGMKRIDGEWFGPVQAAVKIFAKCSERMQELEERADYDKNPKVKQARDMLVARRDDTAKSLPGLVQSHIPSLLEEKKFTDAVEETMAFLRFWIEQVVGAGGPAGEAIRQMDFGYILRMQEKVMEAYRDAGKGNEKPRGVKVPQDMVCVPGGYFLMGDDSDSPGRSDFPMHIVFVSPFLIDKYEVSNAQYRKFVEHVKSSGDYAHAHPDAPPLKKHDADGWSNASLNGDKQPVVGVDWYDAYGYAKWAGKRLPTEAEWEKAARGMDARPFPWGDLDPASTCCANWDGSRKFIAAEMDRQNPPVAPQAQFGCGCVKEQDMQPPPPTSIPAKTWDVDKMLPARAVTAVKNELLEWDKGGEFLSPYGVYHMAGNAAEWVNDLYSEKYYRVSPVNDPQGPETPDVSGEGWKAHVIRGGSYRATGLPQIKVLRRDFPRNKAMADGPGVGFRCAKSLDIVR